MFFPRINIKQFISKTDNKRLAKNYVALVIIQAINNLLPLITFPYLIRVLGFDKFGLLGFAQAVMIYFTILADYGFNLTGNKEVSINRKDTDTLSKIVSTIFTLKTLIVIGGFIVLLILVLLVPKLSNYPWLFIFSYLTVVGQTFFPTWFFQGMERMGIITLLSTLAKAASTILIFVLIKSPEDFIYVPLINSLGFILSAVLSVFILVKQFKIRFHWPTVNALRRELKEGFSPLVSNIYVSLYTSTNILILSFFASDTHLGYYNTCEKIVQAAVSFVGLPINRTLYPFLAKKFAESTALFYRMVLKVQSLLLLILTGVAISVFIFAPIILEVLTKQSNSSIVLLLRILSVTIITLPFGGYFTQLFVILGIHYRLKTIMSYIVLLNFALVFPLVYLFKLHGLAITIVSIQSLLISILYFQIKHRLKSFAG